MVSWYGDGLIAGYDPLTKRLKADLYHLATPGTVDLQGVTRLHYALSAGINLTVYPNTLQAKAPMTFTSADFTANPGKYLGPAMLIAPAAHFPDGYIPKPSEIYGLGEGKVVARLPDLIAGSAGTRTYTFQEFNEYWDPNNKWWICIYPAAWVNGAPTNTLADIPPMKGVSMDTIGRAVSIWSNRTPAKPVITSPLDGSVTLPGATFDFTYDPGDPDTVIPPDDTDRANRDVAGVQIQYRPMPTPDDPAPEWVELPMVVSTNNGNFFRADATFLWQQGFLDAAGYATTADLVSNLGLPVYCGFRLQDDDVIGQGVLPAGEWQLRCRTADYGMPYPANPALDVYGWNPANNWYVSFDSYQAANLSDWSDPVHVSVPAQVPPPTPLSPKNDVAVSGNLPVRLSWTYRNTHQPPRNQYQRAVQIRKVGDPDWATVYDGTSSATFVDLPLVLTQIAIPPIYPLADPGFESGGLDGWVDESVLDPPSAALTNQSDPTKAHSGSRYLRRTSTDPSDNPRFSHFTADVSPEYTTVDFDAWLWIPAIDGGIGVVCQLSWFDADFHQLGSEAPAPNPYLAVAITDFINAPMMDSGWYRLSELFALTPNAAAPFGLHIKRPDGGTALYVSVAAVSLGVGAVVNEARFDDATLVLSGPEVDDFSMSATNQYEWRVQATDTDGLTSDYSAPARFWMVPEADSGEVRPVPSETIDEATLGCGTHRVEIYRRGGKQRVGEITNISHVDWSRVRDDISTSKIVVSGWDVDCGNLLAKLQTWAYEVVIHRDNGYSTDRVWEGPITLLTYEQDKVTIEAKDVMGYLYRRIIKQAMNDAGSGHGTTVVDRARRVIQNALAPDDPNILAYLQVLARDDDAMQYRSTPAYSRTAFEEVDDMAANAGLDYTTVGRSIMLWGTKHRIGTLPEFRDEDLGAPPIVSEYGMSMANRYAVSDGNGVWGEATRLDVSGNDPIYGLVEMLSSTWASDSESDEGTYTQAGLQTVIESFESFAERSIADRYPPPVVVRVPDNTTLNPDTVISIQHLVPGVVVPLRSSGTLRTVVASQKLDKVNVVEENGNETISITLSPFSRDDATPTDDTGGDV